MWDTFSSLYCSLIVGVLHKQSEELCDPGKCGMSFLEDLAGVSDSPYGRGVVEKLIRQDQNTRQIVCFSALYLCRYLYLIDTTLILTLMWPMSVCSSQVGFKPTTLLKDALITELKS